jgi:hypothetical protein
VTDSFVPLNKGDVQRTRGLFFPQDDFLFFFHRAYRADLHTRTAQDASLCIDADIPTLDDDGVCRAYPNTGSAYFAEAALYPHHLSYLSDVASMIWELGVELSRQLFLRFGGISVG